MDEKEGKGVPFVKGSETSTAAADSMVKHAKSVEVQILSLFMEVGYWGLTDDEIEQRLGLKHQTVSARRRQLEKNNLIVKMYKDGKRMKRPTRSGRQAGVYISRRIYDKSNDPVVNPPVYFDYSTQALVSSMKKFVQYADRRVREIEQSDGATLRNTEAIQELVAGFDARILELKVKARIVWKEQKSREAFPQ